MRPSRCCRAARSRGIQETRSSPPSAATDSWSHCGGHGQHHRDLRELSARAILGTGDARSGVERDDRAAGPVADLRPAGTTAAGTATRDREGQRRKRAVASGSPVVWFTTTSRSRACRTLVSSREPRSAPRRSTSSWIGVPSATVSIDVHAFFSMLPAASARQDVNQPWQSSVCCSLSRLIAELKVRAALQDGAAIPADDLAADLREVGRAADVALGQQRETDSREAGSEARLTPCPA